MMPTQKNNSHIPYQNLGPWQNNPNSIWLSSTISLFRNLEKFNFPAKLSGDKRQQIIALVSRDLLANSDLKNPKLIRAEEMLPVEKEFLVEHFLSDQDLNQTYTGEAFVLDDTGEFLAVLNLRDHIFLQYIDAKDDLENTWARLLKVELGLNKVINFAFSPKFGFLSSNPIQSGTALVVTIFLHLPALIYSDRFVDIVKKNNDEGVELTGLQGDPSELVGDIVAFHNNYTLGVTEENIVASLRTLATKLVVEEKSLRQHLKNSNESELAEVKDKVSRAYAILLHSYQIEAVEALQAISFLKLGLDLEWVRGTDQATLNRLLFGCRRAHLMCDIDKKMTHEVVPHRRAEFIHKALKGIELLIS